jgi:uncharacterized protein YegP (UPF0339 family)
MKRGHKIMPNRIEIYKDKHKLWRYRIRAGNNKISDASEQGFRSYYYALYKAKLAAGSVMAEVDVLESPPDDVPPTDSPTVTGIVP